MQTSVFMIKLLRVGGGGGPMECGKVGCNQDREPAGPKIDPSKAFSKKDQRIQYLFVFLYSDFTQHQNFHPLSEEGLWSVVKWTRECENRPESNPKNVLNYTRSS